MVEHVVEVRTRSEGYALGDFEVLADADIRIKKSRPTIHVANLIWEGCHRTSRSKPSGIETTREVLVASSLPYPDYLRRKIGRHGIVVANEGACVKHLQWQSGAGEEVLRQSPAA